MAREEGSSLNVPGLRSRWRAPALASILAVGLVLGTGPAPAAAWSNGACPTSSGVTVVVDFTALDAGVVVRCVPGAPSSGVAALADAGFDVTLVTTMPGFVCRIDGRPGAGAESCASTPPADAYWSYWTAPRGGAWAYSAAGPAGSRPAQGAVEGWAFTTSATASPPSVAPPPPAAAATPRPTVAPTARPTIAPTPVATPRASAALASPTPSAQVSETATARPSPSATDKPVTPSPSASVGSETAAPSAHGQPAPPASEAGEGPIGTVAGIGLAVLVGGGALALQRRSRRDAAHG
jgi:hypothetical protein